MITTETPIVPEICLILLYHFEMKKCFSFLFLAFCSVILSTVEGQAFSECTSEDQAIDWLRQRIESNEKIDKNIISIVYIFNRH